MRARWLAAVSSILIVLTCVGARLPAAQQAGGDEEAIRRLIAAHAAASHQADLRGLVDVYHPDADVRFSDGTVLRGRAEIENSYRESLSSNPREVTHDHPPETVHIRFLRPDVAFVDVESVSGGGTDRAGIRVPVSRTPLFVVFTKEQGRWGVADQRSGVPLK